MKSQILDVCPKCGRKMIENGRNGENWYCLRDNYLVHKLTGIQYHHYGEDRDKDYFIEKVVILAVPHPKGGHTFQDRSLHLTDRELILSQKGIAEKIIPLSTLKSVKTEQVSFSDFASTSEKIKKAVVTGVALAPISVVLVAIGAAYDHASGKLTLLHIVDNEETNLILVTDDAAKWKDEITNRANLEPS